MPPSERDHVRPATASTTPSSVIVGDRRGEHHLPVCVPITVRRGVEPVDDDAREQAEDRERKELREGEEADRERRVRQRRGRARPGRSAASTCRCSEIDLAREEEPVVPVLAHARERAVVDRSTRRSRTRPPRAGASAARSAASSRLELLGVELLRRAASQAVRFDLTERSTRWPAARHGRPTRRRSPSTVAPLDQAGLLEAADELRHSRDGHPLARRELADADPRRVLDLDQQRHLPAGDAERVDLAAQLPVELQQNRPEPVRERRLCRVAVVSIR